MRRYPSRRDNIIDGFFVCPQCGNHYYPIDRRQKTCGRHCGALAGARKKVEARVERLLRP